jgi:hypothetical protein
MTKAINAKAEVVHMLNYHGVNTWGHGGKTAYIFKLRTRWKQVVNFIYAAPLPAPIRKDPQPVKERWQSKKSLCALNCSSSLAPRMANSNKDFSLLGCCTVSLGKRFLMFRTAVPSPSGASSTKNSHSGREVSHLHLYITPYLPCIYSWTACTRRWRHYGILMCWELPIQQHCITSQKTQIQLHDWEFQVRQIWTVY